jgi:putative flippase GtrA
MTLNRAIILQIVRWFTIGVVFAAIGLGLIHGFAGYLGWPYSLATLCSGETCTLLRFLVIDRSVFGHRRPTWKRLWQYHAANLIGFGIWWSAANVLQLSGVHYLLAAVLAMFFSVGFSFASNFFWIWRKPASDRT